MMSMTAKVGLALAGVGAVAVVASKSSPKKKRKSKPKRVGGLKAETTKNEPLCFAYPSGAWAGENAGYVDGVPADKPGWTPEESARVKQAVSDAMQDLPEWDGMLEGRRLAFDIIKKVYASFCPNTKLPEHRHQVNAYRKQSLAFQWAWDTIDDLVWQRMTPGVT